MVPKPEFAKWILCQLIAALQSCKQEESDTIKQILHLK